MAVMENGQDETNRRKETRLKPSEDCARKYRTAKNQRE